jgi:predicted lipoprotein
MFRPKMLLTSLAIALGACSPQDPQAVTSAALAEQIILPSYSRWVDADQQLARSAVAYCQGKEDLETARRAFLSAQKAWAELQPVLIGPITEGNRAWQVQFWPDKKNLVARQVEQLIRSDEPITESSLEKASVVVQGLSAYEYVLFDSSIELADDDTKARYCPMLEAVAAHQRSLADEILANWNAKDGMLHQMSRFPNERYAESKEAISDLFRAQVTALDSLKKKLGAPLGRQSKGIPQPFQAEAWRSQASLSNIAASLDSARKLWSGANGKDLKALLPSDNQELAKQIDDAYEEAQKHLDALAPPLDALLKTDDGRAALNRFYDSLNVVHRLHQTELAKALNVQIGFNANDGD